MKRYLSYSLILLFLFVSTNLLAQKLENPVLFPFELNERGNVSLPDPIPEGNLIIESRKMELRDIPKKSPYRTVAYFESGKLFTLHVLFGETNDGLSFDDYLSIRKILKQLWDKYPNQEYNGRYYIGNKSWIWETADFRIEWIYQNQPGSTSKKMGWLYFTSRHKTNDKYNIQRPQ
ncbi:MAG: hypothetical protein Q8K02_08945 [Flavobacterium sp.]|nr:hypothetical protein [Flavobacterium sp.]